MKMRWEWNRVLIGTVASAGLLLGLCAVGAALVSMERIPEEGIRYLAAGILIGASFAGGMLSGGAVEALGTGVGLWLVLAGINGVLFDFHMSGVGETLAAIAGGCGAAALLQGRKMRRSAKRRKAKIVKLNKRMH